MERPLFAQQLEEHRGIDLVPRSKWDLVTPVSRLVVVGDFERHASTAKRRRNEIRHPRRTVSHSLAVGGDMLRGAESVLEFNRATKPRKSKLSLPKYREETAMFGECVLFKELVTMVQDTQLRSAFCGAPLACRCPFGVNRLPLNF